MDRYKPRADQREQRLRRSKEEWEQLACKVLLLSPEYALYLRDHFNWRRDQHDPAYAGHAKLFMVRLEIEGTCARSTFSNGISMALRRMKMQARDKLKEQSRD